MSYLAQHPAVATLNRSAQAKYEANLARAVPVRMSMRAGEN